MTSLSRLLCFSLILTDVVLLFAPEAARAQSPGTKARETASAGPFAVVAQP
jgi:hypothetical protein